MPATVDVLEDAAEDELALAGVAFGDEVALEFEAAEPVAPAKLYHGWVMLPLAMLVMIATSPGQTFGITFFNTKFREAFDLSQTRLSFTYLLATVVASFGLPYIGGLTDRFGLKRSILVAVALMATACALTSQVQGVVSLFAAFVFLRMIGPGTMTLLANNTLATWFDRRLGLVSGMMQVGMAGALRLVPAGMVGLIGVFGWRGAYLALAAILAGGLLPLLWFVYRESPEVMGQFLDGDRSPADDHAERALRGMTVQQAMHHRSYWILLATTATWSLIGTGMVFHLDGLFQSHGLGVSDSMRAIGFLALGMATTQVLGGLLADRVELRWLAMIAQGTIAISCMMLATGDPGYLTAGYAVYGLAQGFMSIVASTSWARFFGRAHLGKIRGTSLTAAIAGSSVGPLVMGVSADYWGGFETSLWLFACGAGMVAVAACWATAPVEDGVRG